MRDRLIELILKCDKEYDVLSCYNERPKSRQAAKIIADQLLANGVIVPPDELYSIVDKGTIYATVSKAMIDWLPLYVIENPQKYGYYKTKEDAERALKGGV